MPPCVKRKFNDDWLLGIMNLMTVRGMLTVKILILKHLNNCSWPMIKQI